LKDRTKLSLRDGLRLDTAEAHERVDALFGGADFATLRGYRAFLLAQAVAWETLRPILEGGSLARADALRQDLDALAIPHPSPLAGTSLPPALSLGHRYVLEGSRLGSAVLLRDLRDRSPDIAERAGAYLRESGNVDGWKQLSTSLQMTERACGKEGRAVDDALFIFGLFERSWRAADGALPELS